MKKIGVVTLYGNHNMGNKLQTYAVMRLYHALGHDTVIINHHERELFAKSALGWAKAWISSLVCPDRRLKSRRRRLFLAFTKHWLNPSETVSMRRVPAKLKERYDFFSVGSDQVWHNWTRTPEELRFFFLRFADKRQRLCLSPSFGLENIPEGEAAAYREGLEGFPRLSCREASGVKMIRDLTGRDAVLLPDPTICLSAAEWERLERKPAYSLPERYILSYMLGKLQAETMDAVSRYARLLDAEVVNINDSDNNTEYYAATGPREFLYLIRHAYLVCTNSFHGTAFSILFRRNFLCFHRDDSALTGDMGNRLITLLDKFHLASRRYGVLSDENLLVTDYADAEETLFRERERVLDYLREALADSGEN